MLKILVLLIPVCVFALFFIEIKWCVSFLSRLVPIVSPSITVLFSYNLILVVYAVFLITIFSTVLRQLLGFFAGDAVDGALASLILINFVVICFLVVSNLLIGLLLYKGNYGTLFQITGALLVSCCLLVISYVSITSFILHSEIKSVNNFYKPLDLDLVQLPPGWTTTTNLTPYFSGLDSDNNGMSEYGLVLKNEATKQEGLMILEASENGHSYKEKLFNQNISIEGSEVSSISAWSLLQEMGGSQSDSIDDFDNVRDQSDSAYIKINYTATSSTIKKRFALLFNMRDLGEGSDYYLVGAYMLDGFFPMEENSNNKIMHGGYKRIIHKPLDGEKVTKTDALYTLERSDDPRDREKLQVLLDRLSALNRKDSNGLFVSFGEYSDFVESLVSQEVQRVPSIQYRLSDIDIAEYVRAEFK